jgi:Tetratricopeptide repeat
LERSRVLDTAGSSLCGGALNIVAAFVLKATNRLIRTSKFPNRTRSTLLAVVLCCCLRAAAQGSAREIESAEKARQLANENRWQDLVLLLGPPESRSAEMNFYYGTALARLERWPEAEDAFQAGFRMAPSDPRFPIELAGSAFRQKHYSQATQHLRQAIRLAPDDAYANNFLGTVYFLEGNLEAALKYWNRVSKPQVVEVREAPLPKISPALLDRAFAFSPAGTLQLRELQSTDARIRGLGIFPRFQFDLRAREDDKFDVLFRAQERNGFGSTKWEGLFLLLRGLPFSSVYPEYYNLHHDAINFVSQYRWDAQKRRIFAEISGPFERGAKCRYELAADLRGENWALLRSFTGPAPLLGSLNLRREAVEFDLASHASGQLRWSAGGEISHRDFRSVVPGAALSPELLRKGYQLKQQARLDATLYRLPERRFTVEAEASSDAARLWSQPRASFEKLQGSAGWHWLPRAEGDDYETRQQFRAGKTFGSVPFDELFMLGLERDNNLPMRAHIGTRDGRKGSAPLGRNYVLTNWETDKNVYSNGVITVKAGPFVDTGTITDPLHALGSHEWLWDVGAQAKVRVFGSGVVFSYGKDLRSGNNAFYVALLK